MQLGMVCMNGGAAMPSLKLWGQGLPRKAHAPGHVMPSKPASSHVNLAVLLANRGQQGPDGGCPAVLQGLVWVIGDASGWDPSQHSADGMVPQRQALDSLFKAVKSFAKNSCGAVVVMLHLAPKLPSLSLTSVNIYGVR